MSNPYHNEGRANIVQETINNSEILLYGRVTYVMCIFIGRHYKIMKCV